MTVRPFAASVARRAPRLALLAAAVLVAAALAAPARAVTETRIIGPFTVTFYGYLDSDGTNWGWQNWTTPQMDDFTAAFAACDDRITNTPGRQIVVHAFWDYLDPGVLGQTLGPNNGDGSTSWSYVEHIWRDGVNYNGRWDPWDAYVIFDIDAAGTPGGWNFGPAPPAANQIDFRSVVSHEAGHGHGIAATYYKGYMPPFDDAYDDKWGGSLGTETDPYDFAGYQGLSRWDQNLVDPAGNRPLIGGTGTPGNFDECGDPVYFTGANAVAYYGQNVPIYAPYFYEGGSSLSHLNDAQFPDALMAHAIGEGDMRRAPTRLEWEMLKDLGWSVLTTRTWTKGALTFNWGDAGNWDPNGLPDQTWDVTFTNAGLAAGNAVALGGHRTVNALLINSNVSFFLGEAASTLTLAHGRLTRSAASSGSQIIRSPLSVGPGGVWDIGGGGELFAQGGIIAESFAVIEKQGAGILTVEGPQDWGAHSTLVVDAGTVNLCTDAGSAAERDLSIEINGGTVNFRATQHLDALTIGAGGKAVLTPGGSKVLVLNSLWIDTGALTGAGPLNPVPEPATLALVALGAALVLRRRQR